MPVAADAPADAPEGQHHAALVLAAGGSRRLGIAKQLLTRDGETLARRAARLAAATRPDLLVVVTGHLHDQIAREVAGIAHRIAYNPDWRTGLAGSLRAAAAMVRDHRAVLVLACDQPALDLAHLQALLAGAAHAGSRCAATACGQALGVPAVVPGDWFAATGPSHADHGFRQRLRGLAPGALHRVESPGMGDDIDTPTQLEHARGRGLVDR